MRYGYLFLIFFLTQTLFAQLEWGAKLGAAFPADTKLLTLVKEDNRLEKLENQVTGMQLGFYAQIKVASLFIRPEVHYANTQLTFKNFNYSEGALEIPVSVGLKLLPMLSIYVGPTMHYQLNEKIKEAAFLEAIKKETTFGFHLGTRVHLGNFGIGIRYERPFSSNELKIIENNVALPFGTFDKRPKQFLLDLSFRF